MQTSLSLRRHLTASPAPDARRAQPPRFGCRRRAWPGSRRRNDVIGDPPVRSFCSTCRPPWRPALRARRGRGTDHQFDRSRFGRFDGAGRATRRAADVVAVPTRAAAMIAPRSRHRLPSDQEPHRPPRRAIEFLSVGSAVMATNAVCRNAGTNRTAHRAARRRPRSTACCSAGRTRRRHRHFRRP